ncbi:MOG interacting and ectopic P-granules protein 1 isoform X2 [Contarinia nasturtii]|uniref:MOG interacting and ectopic P-granules protein 1 isoform X2 n=1 Tax=Contarinia nasturtii TaxID=265458 RepID=UPI0012D3F8A9|nr:MOG interacting and ectopic P-granules protein 1 isoform X2 [Contarinia nasturtii]
MGEVGTNSADSPNADLKMNGGINGNCDDEAMEVEAQDTSNETIAKNAADSSDQTPPPTSSSSPQTVNDSKDEVMEIDSSGNSDELISNDKTNENDIQIESVESLAHENGDPDAKDKCDQESSEKEISNDLTENLENADDTESNKIIDDNDSTVKVISGDPLSADAEPMDDEDGQGDEGGEDGEVGEDTRTNQSPPQSTENGTSATVTSSSDKKDTISKDPISIDDEIHAISDSEDEEAPNKTVENPLKDVENKALDDGQSNGIAVDDDDDDANGGEDDKPVSVDSDSESELPNKDEVHEILSDKEDCVVIEDDKKADGSNVAARSVNRNRKSTVRAREDYSAYDDDIEEIIEDPLEESAPKRPRLTDPLSNESRKQSGDSTTSKEPTLVIIDTNTILSRGTAANVQALNKSNVSVTAVGDGPVAPSVYPIESRASITPVPNNSNNQLIGAATSTTLAGLNAPVLTALTDDMFVLEAPSFIVPYIYEKPPTEDLKEIVHKMGVEIEERKKLEEQNDKDEQQPTEDAKDDKKSENEEIGEKKPASKKRKPTKNADDSWDESDLSTDDEADSDAEDTRVLIKEAKADLDAIKTHIISRDLTKDDPANDDKKDGNNYFDSPLGKFFSDIGVNLVQEYVQLDLLKQQRRKLSREGNQASPSIQVAINSLMKNLELSKDKNDVFKFETKKCQYCVFKSESALVMANHYEVPHPGKVYQYRCNFCAYEAKQQYDILLHKNNLHCIQGRIEKPIPLHQCPNCPFEDNGRSKLARHAVVCSKKFRPEMNLAPPLDWDPPAKIPRIKPRHGLVGTANAYQAMAAQAQRAANAAAMQRQTVMNVGAVKNRGRPQTITKVMPTANNMRGTQQQSMRPQNPGGVVLPNNFQVSNHGQYIQPTGSKSQKSSQQPSISITALPRQSQPGIHSTTTGLSASNAMQSASLLPKPSGTTAKPGQNQGGKASFVICEICDGWIKDLDQLRNHMQWMHKVKIHPKMIYNRPPLNCQKCQFRFFTDQGLERHLLGSHGLVTSSMQEAANKGRDAGRCPVCGRMYQWKLLNHVSREHNMTLKPAHLSYKCTVCTATFGMYKQFENHVYSAHSTVAKKSNNDSKSKSSTSSSSSGGNNTGNSTNRSSSSGASASILKQPFKINDEITITPQPASRNNRSMEIESHVID